MTGPVWSLIAKVNLFSGSTGWHRFNLIDQFIKRADEWFFLGVKTTAHWDPWGNLVDITNQFVLEGVRGGLITLILFAIIVHEAVKIPGRFSTIAEDQKIVWLSWGICVSVLSHFINFWGVSYFGQIYMLLYITFSMVSACLDIDRVYQNSIM
jgi:hypothetical protein